MTSCRHDSSRLSESGNCRTDLTSVRPRNRGFPLKSRLCTKDVINSRWLFTRCIFGIKLSLRGSVQKLLLKRTTSDRLFFSSTSFLSILDVFLIMILDTRSKIIRMTFGWNWMVRIYMVLCKTIRVVLVFLVEKKTGRIKENSVCVSWILF